MYNGKKDRREKGELRQAVNLAISERIGIYPTVDHEYVVVVLTR